MNISASTIYLWQLADQVRDTMGTLFPILCVPAVILGILTIIFYAVSATRAGEKRNYPSINRDMDVEVETKRWLDYSKGIGKWCGKCATSALMVGCVYTLFPTSNTVAMMVVIPKIAESKVIQQDLPDIYNAAVEALKGAIKKP